MNIYIFIIFLFISFSFQKEKDKINNGVYNIMWNNLYLQYYKRKIITCNILNHPSTFFRINKINNTFENYFYYIEEIYSIYRNKLSYNGQKELIIPKQNIFELSFWIFIKLENKKYIILNRNNCFVIVTKYNTFICDDIPLEKATQFDIIKIYEEVEENVKNNNIIEKEPIDVLIKLRSLKYLTFLFGIKINIFLIQGIFLRMLLIEYLSSSLS